MRENNMHIFIDEYTRRKSNYIEDPKIANEIDDEEASTNDTSNQMIQQPIYKIGYYDRTEAVL